MRARALTHWRIDQKDGGYSHCQSYQEAAHVRVHDAGTHQRGRMLQQCQEGTGRNHEDAQTEALDHVFRPVLRERLFCVVRPMPNPGLGSHGFFQQLRCEPFHRRGWRALEFTSHVRWDSEEHKRLRLAKKIPCESILVAVLLRTSK